MSRPFINRAEAGRVLGQALADYRNLQDPLVLAVPRGGVPVGREVAAILQAPLDVFVVRKLGLPGREELAMGAIASGGIRVFNERVFQFAQVDNQTLEEVAAREAAELERCERIYRGDRPFPRISGRTVVLVDDCLATGSSMLAAVRAVHAHHPRFMIVAAPVACPDTVENLQRETDDVVVLLQIEDLVSVVRWYADSAEVSDLEIHALLEDARTSLSTEQ